MGTKKTFGNIMIVDDDPENLRLLGKSLSQQGYEVRSIPNSTAALQSVEKDPDQQPGHQ